MPGVTAGVQQLATWGTGDLVIYGGAVGLVIVGFMCFAARMAIIGFIACVVGIAIASGGIGIARWVYNVFHSASLEQPANGTAYAELRTPASGSYAVLATADGQIAIRAAA
jgi:hypothetical protein